MNENDRRMLFQLLDDTEYEEFKNVLGRMPYVDIKVVDNKATTFTAGSIITVCQVNFDVVKEIFKKSLKFRLRQHCHEKT